MPRPRLVVVHWEPSELADKVRLVEDAGGHVVASEGSDGARAGRLVREQAPEALVVWLARLPSHGRMTAAYVASQPWGHDLPILLIDHDPEPTPPATLQRIRAAVPQALVIPPAALRLWLSKLPMRAPGADA